MASGLQYEPPHLLGGEVSGNEILFLIVPYDSDYKGGIAGHLPVNSSQRKAQNRLADGRRWDISPVVLLPPSHGHNFDISTKPFRVS